MAKKETVSGASTVASMAAEKVAAGIMRNNPEIKEVHVASDGTAFYSRNDAQNYAKGLKNHEVLSFKRGNTISSAAAAASAKTKRSSTVKKAVIEEQEVDELTGEVVNEEADEESKNDNV